MVMVGALSRHERVQPGVVRRPDQRAAAAGHDAQPADVARSTGDHVRLGTADGEDALRQRGERKVRRGPDPHPLTLPLPESSLHRKVQRSSQQDVVAHLGMHVQGKVGAVERHVRLEQGSQAPVAGAGQWQRLAPEQPVVHKEQLGSLVGRGADRLQGPVRGGRHPVDRRATLDLQAVMGARIVGDRIDGQVAVQPFGQLSQIGHRVSPTVTPIRSSPAAWTTRRRPPG